MWRYWQGSPYRTAIQEHLDGKEDVPPGSDLAIGDITNYAPWGNLAIFYQDFGYASGLVILGRMDGSIEEFDVPSSVEATIELVE